MKAPVTARTGALSYRNTILPIGGELLRNSTVFLPQYSSLAHLGLMLIRHTLMLSSLGGDEAGLKCHLTQGTDRRMLWRSRTFLDVRQGV